MCGICGILFKNSSVLLLKTLVSVLYELQNRGYDSVGISFIENNEFRIHKGVGQNALQTIRSDIKGKITDNGVGHTRWATHGGATVDNAHPHLDTIIGRFTIVHNGVIINYKEIKDFLLNNHISVRSETDTEVFLNLFVYNYCNMRNTIRDDDKLIIINALQYTIDSIEGTFGVIIQSLDHPHILFCVRRGSPMLIGRDDENDLLMIISEKQAFPKIITRCFTVPSNKIVVCDIDQMDHEYAPIVSLDTTLFQFSTDHSFLYTTEKEIFDQIHIVGMVSKNGSRFGDQKLVKLGGMPSEPLPKNIYLFGCGSSFHACLMLEYLYHESGLFENVHALDTAQTESIYFSSKKPSTGVFLSQSGETKDTLTILEEWKKCESTRFSVGITNVVDSCLSVETECGVYMNVGKEKGVASTKAFTGQVLCGILLLLWFQQNESKNALWIHDLTCFEKVLPSFIPFVFQEMKSKWSIALKQYKHLFILGRGLDYFVAREGALKIKEIAYLPSEAYPASSLKHGPFALLDEEFPVIFISSNPDYDYKNRNSILEILARRSPIFLITTQSSFDRMGLTNEQIQTCIIPEQRLSFLCANIALQCLAFHLSIEFGLHPDFPRNLAKVVTVE